MTVDELKDDLRRTYQESLYGDKKASVIVFCIKHIDDIKRHDVKPPELAKCLKDGESETLVTELRLAINHLANYLELKPGIVG